MSTFIRGFFSEVCFPTIPAHVRGPDGFGFDGGREGLASSATFFSMGFVGSAFSTGSGKSPPFGVKTAAFLFNLVEPVVFNFSGSDFLSLSLGEFFRSFLPLRRRPLPLFLRPPPLLLLYCC